MAQVQEKEIPTEIVSVEAVRSIEQQRNGTIAEANQHQVKNRVNSEYAVTLLKRLTGMIDYVNEELNPSVKKAYESHKTILALKNKILKPLLDAKKELSVRNQAWCRAEEDKVEQARLKAKEEARKTDEKRAALQDYHESVGHETTVLEPTEVEEVEPFIPTTKERTKYDVKVINKQLVPEEYKVVDLVKIRKLMFAAARNESNKPIFEMLGIEVFNVPVLVYR